ncbi:MAG TPA: cobalamin biosynthesis protein, partial [Solirubrobacteraceae bacterium]|nr:cobalamin biosynthesis protein [Solirubrobacteraceae bacterium]
MTARGGSRRTALWTALAADLAVGDPPHRLHPVGLAGAALGRSYAPFRRRSPAVQFLGGTLALAGVAGAAGAGAHLAERALRRLPAGAAALGVALKPTLALRQLLQEGWLIARALDAGDLDGARGRVSTIVSRPTADLGPPEIAAATIESV